MEMLKNGELNDVHFIEIMACPGGCLGGGGQPYQLLWKSDKKSKCDIW